VRRSGRYRPGGHCATRGTSRLTESAYCQARARLPDQTLLRVHEQLADRLERNVPSQSRWRGRNVKIADGTNLSMPDTAQNQGAYPQPSSQKPGCGFPMMKLVGIFSPASGALLHFARGSLHIHDASTLSPTMEAFSQRRCHSQ
jgi:hypothetical protein